MRLSTSNAKAGARQGSRFYSQEEKTYYADCMAASFFIRRLLRRAALFL